MILFGKPIVYAYDYNISLVLWRQSHISSEDIVHIWPPHLQMLNKKLFEKNQTKSILHIDNINYKFSSYAE